MKDRLEAVGQEANWLDESAVEESVNLVCNSAIRMLAEHLLGPDADRVIEYELPNRRPEYVQRYLLRRSIGDLLIDPCDSLRRGSEYVAIPWPVYATREYEHLEKVTVGALQIPRGNVDQPDWQTSVFVRFYWDDPGSGQVIETISLETFESRKHALPKISEVVEFRRNTDEDFELWRSETRGVTDEPEAQALANVVNRLFSREYAA